jgi:hypothetical protein
MRRSDDIVSLASWRQHGASRRSAALPRRPPPSVRVFVAGVVVFSAALVLVGLSLAAQQTHRGPAEIARTPPAERAAWVSRALTDVTAGCTPGPRVPSLLRQHCQAQARFLLAFPECDAGCRAIAAHVLDPAWR